MTHYIPAFTERNGHQQRTVCGTWIRSNAHSAEPTCAECRAYLQQSEDDDEATARALEAEFPEFSGKLVTR